VADYTWVHGAGAVDREELSALFRIAPLGDKPPEALAALLLAAFELIESRQHAPLVPLQILRWRTLAGADAVMLLVGTVAVGMGFILTLYAQVLGNSAVKFGGGVGTAHAGSTGSSPTSLSNRHTAGKPGNGGRRGTGRRHRAAMTERTA